MALNDEDARPLGIQIPDAYSAVRRWYQLNISKALGFSDNYGRSSAQLIRNLPPAADLSETEQCAILREVVIGYLEWGFHSADDEGFKMGAYALETFECYCMPFYLTPEQNAELLHSSLWPFLSPHSKK